MSGVSSHVHFIFNRNSCMQTGTVLLARHIWVNPLQHVNLNPHLLSGLFHPYQMDESISIFRGVWCMFSFLFHFEIRIDIPEDPHRVLWRLIWVCTVCLCPKIGTLGYYGLISP